MKVKINKKKFILSTFFIIALAAITFTLISTTSSKSKSAKASSQAAEDWSEKQNNMTLAFEGIGHYGFTTAGSTNLKLKQPTSGYDVKANFKDEDGDGKNEAHLAYQDFSMDAASMGYLYNKTIENGQYAFMNANSTRAMTSLQYVSSEAVDYVKETTGFSDIDGDSSITNITGSRLSFTGTIKHAVLQTDTVAKYENVNDARKIVLVSPKGNKFVLSTDDATRSSAHTFGTVEVSKSDMAQALSVLADKSGVLDNAGGISKTDFINKYLKEQHGHEKTSFDITDIVNQEGEGFYYVNLPALDYNNYSGSNSRDGVWSIVAVEENETKYPNLRYLALKTGQQSLGENKKLTMSVPNVLRTSAVSPKANVLVVANDGDPKIGSDEFSITSTASDNTTKTVKLYTEERPVNDFLNSTLDTYRKTTFKNSFELDIVDMDVSDNILPKSNLSIASSTTGESIGFRAIGIATDILVPQMKIEASIADINGGNYLLNGEKVKCSVDVSDVYKEDTTVDTDILSHDAVMRVKVPDNTTYAGNLSVTYYDRSGNTISIPTGATIVYEPTTNEVVLTYPGSDFKVAKVSFDATVNDDTPDGTTLYLNPNLNYHLVSAADAALTSKAYDAYLETKVATTNISSRVPGKVTVKYIDKNTNQELTSDVVSTGMISDTYTVDKKTFDGYTLLNGDDVADSVTYQETEQTLTLYYAKNTSVVINHKDKATDQLLEPAQTIDGYVGKDYTSSNKSFDGYTYDVDSAPTNANGKMTEDQITVTYYYNKNPEGSVITKYVDKYTGAEIAVSKSETGTPGDPYTTTAETVDGYELVTTPANATGNFNDSTIEVVYEYAKKVKVTAKYYDKITGQEISEEYVGNGKQGDPYTTDQKTIDGYTFESVDGEPNGTFEDSDVIVKYYYLKNASVTAKYLDKFTNQPIETEETNTGLQGNPYTTTAKNINGYKLVAVPDNATGNYASDPITVTYYYVKASNVITRYVDKNKQTEIVPEITQSGYQGDQYTTDKKDIPGYTYDSVVGETAGTYGDSTKIITYYYIKNTSVEVKYVDKVTGEEISTRTAIPGLPGDAYVTTPKTIDDYTLERTPDNASGTMTDELTTITYEYLLNASVTSKYVDKETGKELAPSETYNGQEGKDYETENKDIKYYKLVEIPSDASGKYEVDRTTNPYTTTKEVIYYYIPKVFDLSVSKKISNITINGKSQDLNDGKIEKIEIEDKTINDVDVRVEYAIVLSNIGELNGSANIVENIPDGFEFVAEDNENYWTVEDGKLVTKVENIDPEQEITLVVKLRWKNSEENLGKLTNVVKISDTKNPAEFKEINLDNNEDSCDTIVEIKKGAVSMLPWIISAIVLVSGTLVTFSYVSKKKSLQSK